MICKARRRLTLPATVAMIRPLTRRDTSVWRCRLSTTLRISRILLFTFTGLLCSPALGLQQSGNVDAAVKLIKSGNVKQGRNLLLKALQENPKDENIRALLGQIAFRRNEYDECVNQFRKAPSVL